MRVITLKPVLKKGKKASFAIIENTENETPFDQLENVRNGLKNLNIERYLIRKSNQSKKMTVGKRF